MSKQDEAGLILRLYELRRDETMRKARDWFFLEFNPQTLADFTAAMFSEHSGHLRMVVSYWDMAAAMVNNGAIGLEFFNDCNGEQFGVFGKFDHLLGDIRATFGPLFAVNFEKMIDATPDGRKRVAMMKERMQAIRSQVGQQQAKGRTA